MSYVIDFLSSGAEEKLQSVIVKLEAIGTKANKISTDLSAAEKGIGKSFKKVAEEAKKVEEANKKVKVSADSMSKGVAKGWIETGKVISEQSKKQITANKAIEIATRKTAAAKVKAWEDAFNKSANSRKQFFNAEKNVLKRIVQEAKQAEDLKLKLSEESKNKRILGLTQLWQAEKKINERVLADKKASLNKQLDLQRDLWAKQLAFEKAAESKRKIQANISEANRLGAMGGTGGVSGFARLAQAEKAIKQNRKLKVSHREVAKAAEKSGKSHVKAAKGVSEYAKSAQRAAKEAAALRAGLNALGTHMGIFTGQTIAVAAAVYGTVSAFKGMVTVGIDFTGELVRAMAIMDATAEQSAQLEHEVRRLAETTVFTGKEAAGGLTALAMAGLSANQALDALAPALDLAAIGQIDMYKASDILTNVMLGFNLTALDTQKIVDDLATAVTSSNSTIDQMGAALSYVAPVAAAAGAQIEEVIGILELFHNVGIKGTRAGTSLRRAYANLQKPSNEAKSALEGMNIATTDVNGNMLELTDIMKQLADQGATNADVFKIFGVRAAPAMQAFLDSMKRAIPISEQFRESLEDNEGAAKNIREAMEKALGPDIRKLLSALQEKAIQVFKVLEPGFRSLAKATTEWIKEFDPKSISDTLKTLGNLAKVLFNFKEVLFAIVAAKSLTFIASSLSLIGTSALTAVGSVEKFGSGLLGMTAKAEGAAAGLSVLARSVKGLLAATGIGLAVVVFSELAFKMYEWATSEDKAAEKTRLLTQEMKKQRLESERLKRSVDRKGTALEAVKGFKDNDLTRLETRRITAFSDLKKFKDQVQYTQIGLLAAEKSGIDFVITSAQNSVELAVDGLIVAAKAYEGAEKAVQTYVKTGLTPAGEKIQADLKKFEENLNKKDFSEMIEGTFSTLEANLEGLKSRYGKGSGSSAVDILIGSEEEFQSAMATLDAQYTHAISGINTKLAAVRRDQFGNIVEVEKYKQLITQLKEEFEKNKSAVEDLQKGLASAGDEFTAYLDKTDNLTQSTAEQISKLLEETAKLNGIKIAVRSATEAKLDARIANLQLAASVLEGDEAHKAEYRRILDQITVLEQLSIAYKNATAARDEAKVDVKDRKKGKTAKGKLLEDFSAGKGLSEDDKAAKVHAARIAQLDSYVEMIEGMKETDDWYVNAKKEADEELLRSQNKVWFEMADSMSKSVGDNIAKAALLDQTWDKTAKNIKRAIVGGIIGTLAEAATKYITTMILDNTLTATKVAGDQTKATSGKAAAASEVVATNAVTSAKMVEGIANQAGGDPYSAFGRIAAMTAIMAGIQGIVQGIMGNISGGREIGGPVSAGQSYIVGERGAEIFTPTTSGAITSNADVKRGLNSGNGQVVNHYYTYEGDKYEINAVDTQSFQQALARNSSYLSRLNEKENRRQAISRR